MLQVRTSFSLVISHKGIYKLAVYINNLIKTVRAEIERRRRFFLLRKSLRRKRVRQTFYKRRINIEQMYMEVLMYVS